MSTLLLRIAAPLMSWGIDSKFDRRGTERVPTKSGIIGLIASALGRYRSDSIEDLRSLHFGVRVDREGQLLCDFQTARNEKVAYITKRYYLMDAVFLVGLEGEEEKLIEIKNALLYPAFPIFFGRRSCPPEGSVFVGIRDDKSLEEALREEALLVNNMRKSKSEKVSLIQIVIDANEANADVIFQRDDPISFDQRHRKFGFRCTREIYFIKENNDESKKKALIPSTEHDPMSELGV